MRELLRDEDAARLQKILEEQADEYSPGLLPTEMNKWDPDCARRVLREVLRGFQKK